ncbi:MAG: hypothetical protein CSA38_02845 [Flavobacteriales bacterium]|nr:MAG: hypothetical protein CSA38_02845 [Flavobacteriales bacterium]
MKNLTTLAIISLSIIACNKDKSPKVITKIDPTTGDTVKVEVASKEDSIKVIKEMKAKAGIKDSAGIYTQGFNLEKGKTYPFISQQNQTQTLKTPDGKSQKISGKTVDEITFTVDDIKDDVYEMTINFVAKRTSQTAQGKTIAVDTQKPAPKQKELKNQWSLDKAMTGNQLKMKMNKKGEILSITGFEPIYKKVATTINTLTKDKKVRKNLIKGSKLSFNEEVLKAQFSRNMMILPKEGIALNKVWSETEKLSKDGKVKMSTHYRLKSVDNNVAVVVVSGGIPKQSDKQTKEGITRKASSEFKQNGTLKFDMTTGWIISQNIQMKTTEKETLSDGKQSQSMTSINTTSVMVNPKNL